MWSEAGYRCIVSYVSWEGLPCRQISALLVTGTQLPGKGHKAICVWLLCSGPGGMWVWAHCELRPVATIIGHGAA